MPAYVTGEGKPYRPDVLLWLNAAGLVLGVTVARPGELLGVACESLRSTIERPMVGRAHAPARVRVASPEIAAELRAGHPSIAIVCGPTPEVEAPLAAMRASMGSDGEEEESYLSPGIEAEAIASFFRSAAQLFRARPWRLVPDDQSIFAVTIEKLGIRDAALSIIGRMGQSLGFVLFEDLDDFEAYLDAADAVERGEQPDMPPHFGLTFDRGSALPTALRKEVAAHRWEVAGPAAYPRILAVDGDLVLRPPTADDVTTAEAIALALPRVLPEQEALISAWNGGEPVSRTFSVCTHAGEVEITLSAPHEREPAPPYDVLADLFDLAKDGRDPDPAQRGRLEDDLLERFVASPEAEDLSDTRWCRLVMDLAAERFGATIATLGPADLGEIVFEIVPRKVSVAPSAARRVVEDNRALYAFLKREYGLRQAAACLRVLGGAGVKKLEEALVDTSSFGTAKALAMGALEAGFKKGRSQGIGPPRGPGAPPVRRSRRMARIARGRRQNRH